MSPRLADLQQKARVIVSKYGLTEEAVMAAYVEGMKFGADDALNELKASFSKRSAEFKGGTEK